MDRKEDDSLIKTETESQFKIIKHLVRENKLSASCSNSCRTSKLSSVELNCKLAAVGHRTRQE